MARAAVGGVNAPHRLDIPARRALVVVDDPGLGELLVETITEAGHFVRLAETAAQVVAALAEARFDAAVVDLDRRARDGDQLVALVRSLAPATTVIALLPCGARAGDLRSVSFHLSLEKPARLQALLTALAASGAS